MQTNEVNADQKKFWNESKGKSWVELQPKIDSLLQPIGDVALSKLNPIEGEKIAEIGCGTGTMSFLISDKVGTSGSVQGFDISKPMLNYAEERRINNNLVNINYTLADLQTYKFKVNSFDALFSRFGVMFFDNPIVAFSNLRGSLKKGGRFIFVCWAERLENDWIELPTKVASRFLELPPTPPEKSPGPFAFEDKEYVASILDKAGWKSIIFENFSCAHSAGESLDEAARFLGNMGPMSGPIEASDGKTREKFFDALKLELSKYKTDEGVMMNFSTWIVSAVTP